MGRDASLQPRLFSSLCMIRCSNACTGPRANMLGCVQEQFAGKFPGLWAAQQARQWVLCAGIRAAELSGGWAEEHV